MDPEVAWLDAALEDLDAIAAYIAADSRVYASVVTQKMLGAAADLSRFPRMGRIVPEWGDEQVRERIVYSYRLIYRIQGDRVVVLAVIHGARLLPGEIRGRS